MIGIYYIWIKKSCVVFNLEIQLIDDLFMFRYSDKCVDRKTNDLRFCEKEWKNLAQVTLYDVA